MDQNAAKAEAFMRHLGPLQAVLEAFVRRALRDPNAVADVLQSAIAAAYRDFQLYVEGTNFRAWIFRFVHLEILNNNRKLKRTQLAHCPGDVAAEDLRDAAVCESSFRELLDDPDPVLERCDEVLSQAVRLLAPAERDVLLLRAIGEFKYREIADILQIPLGTVMSNLARSRARLRQQLFEYGKKSGLFRRDAT
ncbi:MAG: sigma-70 family RNA polymerase sigma factor [Planctomycetia bacterium]|nr:sigma-70 family RNA polymerase sigma factor [Planctomycetia bacterium]